MRFSRAFAWTLAANELALAASFAAGIVLARGLGADGVGTYTLAVASAHLSANVLSAGLFHAVRFLAGRQPDRSGTLLLVATLPVALLALPLAAAMLSPAADWLFAGLRGAPLWISACAALVIALRTNAAGLLLGAQRFAAHSGVTALPALGTLASTAVITALGLDIEAVLAAWLGWQLLALGLALGLAARVARPSLRDLWSLGREALVMGARATVMLVLGFLASRGLFWLVERHLGPAGTGLYAVALVLSEVLQHGANALGTVLTTQAAQRERSPEHVFAVLRLHLLLAPVAALSLAAVAPWLVQFLYGPAFSAVAEPLRVLAFGAVAMGVWTMCSGYLVGRHGYPLALITMGVVPVTVVLVLGSSWLPRFGLFGAALAQACAAAAAAGLSLAVLVRSTTGARLSDVLPGREELLRLRGLAGWFGGQRR